jgi:hypothetical protein
MVQLGIGQLSTDDRRKELILGIDRIASPEWSNARRLAHSISPGI